jgi:hypothetical protein
LSSGRCCGDGGWRLQDIVGTQYVVVLGVWWAQDMLLDKGGGLSGIIKGRIGWRLAKTRFEKFSDEFFANRKARFGKNKKK